MGHAHARWRMVNCLGYFTVLAAAVLFGGRECRAQSATADQNLDNPWSQDVKKYPGLPVELGALITKLRQNVQYPAPRRESRLLPLLPQSTAAYIAFPNYGDAADQALKTLHQELAESSVLRDWWAHGQTVEAGPKVEDALSHFSQFNQFLGEEIVVSAEMAGDTPKLLAMAQVRKPGLKKFLEETIRSWGAAKPPVLVLGPEDLSAGSHGSSSNQFVMLVRPDFFIAAADIATLRDFNARLDAGGREFASSAFGQRVAREYRDGVTVLAAADLHRIVNQDTLQSKQSAAFRQSGFADMQYAVWDQKTIEGKPLTQMELSFTGARHGAASWLANSRPLGSLDFVSPKAMMAVTVALSDPAKIFDDAKELAQLSDSKAFAAIPQLEQALNMSLKDDLLSLLGGELTIELDKFDPPQMPQWKAMLQVKDAAHLQRTLSTLTAPLSSGTSSIENGGVTVYGLRVPSGKTPTEIGYAFVDGYLIVGSGKGAVAEAAGMHKSGGSLAKSKDFLAALPMQGGQNASALFYTDPVTMAAIQMRQFAPGLAGYLTHASTTAPSVAAVYGENSAIREVSGSESFNLSSILVVAAVAIPNLLRARIAANEASAVGSIRTINTAEIVYKTDHPERGFSSSLAALGPNPNGSAAPSPEHAGLLDASLANEDCAGEGWCTKSGYRFTAAGVCARRPCRDFVAIATPVSSSTGTRSFCSTSDGVIRFTTVSPISSQLSVSECRAWPAIQ